MHNIDIITGYLCVPCRWPVWARGQGWGSGDRVRWRELVDKINMFIHKDVSLVPRDQEHNSVSLAVRHARLTWQDNPIYHLLDLCMSRKHGFEAVSLLLWITFFVVSFDYCQKAKDLILFSSCVWDFRTKNSSPQKQCPGDGCAYKPFWWSRLHRGKRTRETYKHSYSELSLLRTPITILFYFWVPSHPPHTQT